MKAIKYLLTLCLVGALAACSDKDYVEIDSLQVFGERFFQGETVNIGVSVSMSSPDDAEYYWSCDGGEMVHRDGYVLNQWKAPRENGIYTIRCTVKCNGASATREAHVLVDGFFFETFGNTTVSVNNSNVDKGTSTGGIDGRYEGVAKSGKYDGIYFGKNLGDGTLYAPVSGEFECGIIGNTRTNTFKPLYPVGIDPPKFGNKDNQCAISIQGQATPSDNPSSYYINCVRVEWWPMEHLQPTIKYRTIDSPSADVTSNREDFDAVVSFQWYQKANAELGIKQTNGWIKMPFKCPALRYDVDVTKRVGLAVDENNIVKFYVDGNEAYTWNGLATYCSEHENAPFRIQAFRYIFPGQTACYWDNVSFYNDGNFGK